MKQYSRFLIFLSVCFSVMCIAHPVHADIYMEQKQHTDPVTMMGQQQPATDIIDKIWISKDKMRSDNAKRSVITRMDQKKIYVLNHQQKTYNEISLEPRQSQQTDSQNTMAMQMMQGMAQQIEIVISPTNETKKISKWNCKKYIQEMKTMMGPITTIIWATEDIKVDTPLFEDFYSTSMMIQPGAGASTEKIKKELQKVKGIYVFTETITFMMNTRIRSTTELLEYKDAKAPPGTYDMQTDYKKIQIPY